MIKPEQIPEAVVYEVFKRCEWDSLGEAAEAIAAALNAWPGKDIVGYGPPFYGIDLILPLPPQENSDAE